MVAGGKFMQWHDASTPRTWGEDPEDLDPAAVMAVVDRLRPWFGPDHAYFRTEVTGWERIPDRPTLFVGNHSGGTSIPDTWGLGVSWYRHFGTARPLHALAHELVFALDPVGSRFAKLGVLRATRTMARRILVDRGRDLMVYPGGDLDTWRPWTDRYKVCFSGRTGYARTAIATQVPVVPVAHAGSHDSLVVLTDGRRLAEKLHFPELFRARVFPVHLSAPFGLGIGPLPHLPPPGTYRYRFGDPIAPPAWEGPGDPPEALVREFDQACREGLQRQLDALRAERPASLRGRVKASLRRAYGQ